jgi:hypothetical protein
MPTIIATLEDGGSSIISYSLEWNSGGTGSTFTELVGYSTANLV